MHLAERTPSEREMSPRNVIALITNDDGIESPGLHRLAHAGAPTQGVTVGIVAPPVAVQRQ